MWFILSILVFVACVCGFAAPALINFKSAATVVRPLPVPVPEFKAWFGKADTPEQILRLNPGLVRIEKLDTPSSSSSSSSVVPYRGHVSPLEFPGLCVSSVIDFGVSATPTQMSFECSEDAIKLEFKGSAILARVVSSIKPVVTSHSILSLNEATGELSNDVSLSIAFPLPDWFPLPRDNIESAGSAIIKTNVVRDAEALVNNILGEFEKTSPEAAAAAVSLAAKE